MACKKLFCFLFVCLFVLVTFVSESKGLNINDESKQQSNAKHYELDWLHRNKREVEEEAIDESEEGAVYKRLAGPPQPPYKPPPPPPPRVGILPIVTCPSKCKKICPRGCRPIRFGAKPMPPPAHILPIENAPHVPPPAEITPHVPPPAEITPHVPPPGEGAPPPPPPPGAVP